MPKVTIIYNPLAGPASLQPVMDHIASRWGDEGWEASVTATQAVGHATTLAIEAVKAGCQLVLAAGGDGTLGEVVNGLAGSETIMGILPVGTANSFARELNIPVPGLLDMQAATVMANGLLNPTKDNKLLTISDMLMAGKVQQMDLGWQVNLAGEGRYWMLWASVGADGYLMQELEPRPKWAKKIGRASYIIRGVPILARFSHVHAKVEVDGHFFEDDYVLVLVSNSRRYAGGLIMLTEQAYLDDGQFEIWLFGGRGFPSITRHALQALRGQHLQQSDAFLVHGRHVVIHTEPSAPLQMDGDPVGRSPLECKIVPKALRLLVPLSTPTDLFQFPGKPLPDVIS
ncbi:MAG: diacylglycerol kinase family lipid kinase [Candidatus Promineifilaceae bacterium]|nr:diacylglycerol kinase family lipid kinase [Candidatus Promineifilaceae bacterium]